MTQPPRNMLGRLERVDLRQAWLGEATDFTPWLAQPENITLLGEAIGIELEVEAQEANVGPFRADILCRDTTSDRYVLIENQLERTDHGHLGQLLTYAAGLDAVTIVWVAARFTDEHRAALDWLNRATTGDFNFFGLEVEVWRIGDSPLAPKFNVVSQPNEWSKSVRASTSGDGEMSDRQRWHLRFWEQFHDYLAERGIRILVTSPSPRHFVVGALGHSHCRLIIFNNVKEGRSGVYLTLTGPDAKAHYHLLEGKYKTTIDATLTPLTPPAELSWRLKPDVNESMVMVQRTGLKQEDPSSWPALDEWLANTAVTMHDLFRPIVKELDPSEWDPSIVVDGAAADVLMADEEGEVEL